MIPRNVRTSLQRNWKALNATIGILVDISILCVAFLISLFFFSLYRPDASLQGSHLVFLVFGVTLYMMAFTIFGIYRAITYSSFRSQLYAAARGYLYISVLMVSAIHFPKRFIASPELYFLFILPLVYVPIWWLVRKGLASVRRLGIGPSRTIAIGSDPDFHELVHRLDEHADLRFSLVSVLRTTKSDHLDRHDHIDVSAVERLLAEHEIDQIVFSSSYQLNGSFNDLHSLCRSRSISMRIVSPESDTLFSKVGLRDIAGIPIYVPEGLKVRFMKRILKRAFDIVGSCALLILFSPVFLVVAIAIKVDSKGPVFFRHRRSLGAGDEPFYFMKFRSMNTDAESEKGSLLHQNESDGALFKMKDDPRLTRVGRFIRRFSLDELPQLINVLIGDMSIVGPRPLPVKDYGRIDRNDHVGGYLHLRAKAKPGMTGLWQISGRSDLGFREMVMLDLYYIENQTILFDLEILAQTVPVVVFGRGAY